jgi:hypothetical protein
MRTLLALVALSLASCAPQTYPECVRALETNGGALDKSIRLFLSIEATRQSLSTKPDARPSIESFSRCCDLPGVYPEDEPLCVSARASLRQPLEHDAPAQ